MEESRLYPVVEAGSWEPLDVGARDTASLGLETNREVPAVVEQSEVNDDTGIVWDSENEASRIVEWDLNATPCSEKDQLQEDASTQKKTVLAFVLARTWVELGLDLL